MILRQTWKKHLYALLANIMSQTLMVIAESSASSSAVLSFHGKKYHCMIGRAGMNPKQKKQEGDGATPIGEYHILRGFYRSDRLEEPLTKGLEMLPITQGMGWEDSPDSSRYNC